MVKFPYCGGCRECCRFREKELSKLSFRCVKAGMKFKCIHLGKDNKCALYRARMPFSCQSYPFFHGGKNELIVDFACPKAGVFLKELAQGKPRAVEFLQSVIALHKARKKFDRKNDYMSKADCKRVDGYALVIEYV